MGGGKVAANHSPLSAAAAAKTGGAAPGAGDETSLAEEAAGRQLSPLPAAVAFANEATGTAKTKVKFYMFFLCMCSRFLYNTCKLE